MKYNNFYQTYGHSYDEYEASHRGRLDFLVEDLKLDKLQGNVADVGCGLGFIYFRLPLEVQNNYYGFDGTPLTDPPFKYKQVDLDTFDSGYDGYFDSALCFETLEHLTNPYHCLMEMKKMVKINHPIHISIPHVDTQHNTIYPGLLYPVQNFIVFLNQMALPIMEHREHRKCFSQHVFTVSNGDWNNCSMLWYKPEEKFRGLPPHKHVNL
jgi:SAM-dependent methyltransferase